MPDSLYRIFQSSPGLNFWQVNQQFLDDAINAGNTFVLSTPLETIMRAENFSSGAYHEGQYLISRGFSYIIENGFETFILPK